MANVKVKIGGCSIFIDGLPGLELNCPSCGELVINGQQHDCRTPEPEPEPKKKSGFPATRAEMIEKGYTLQRASKCRGIGCGRDVEWWLSPVVWKDGKRTGGKYIPMDPMPEDDSPAVTHFSTCPDVPRFRS